MDIRRPTTFFTRELKFAHGLLSATCPRTRSSVPNKQYLNLESPGI